MLSIPGIGAHHARNPCSPSIGMGAQLAPEYALAIRWSSHSFGDVRVFCEQHDKPLVRLPAGYTPKQLAAQILVQCSDRLRSVSAK